jgi:uncharacterized protein YjbJ (UPF0337 family)
LSGAETGVGDRARRANGAAETSEARVKRDAGYAGGKPPIATRWAAEEIKGRAKNTAGKASGAVDGQRAERAPEHRRCLPALACQSLLNSE